jgi:hypothetical protein
MRSFTLLFLLAATLSAAPHSRIITGTVHRGQNFREDVGSGLGFVLAAESRQPREFIFVTTCADYKTESDRFALALYAGKGTSEKEVDAALAKLGTSPTGKGKFTILSYKVGTEIDWIKFKLEIDPRP